MYFNHFIPHPRHVSYSHFACHIHFLFAYVLFFVLLTQYCAGDKIEKNEMGWACGTYG